MHSNTDQCITYTENSAYSLKYKSLGPFSTIEGLITRYIKYIILPIIKGEDLSRSYPRVNLERLVQPALREPLLKCQTIALTFCGKGKKIPSNYMAH